MSEQAAQESITLSPEALNDLMASTDHAPEIIDVREPGEFKRCHIPGAVNVPLGNIEQQDFEQFGSSSLVVCCQSGVRAKQAAETLQRLRDIDVTILEGGINSWQRCQYAVTEDKSAPISIQRQVQIVAGSFVALGTLLGIGISSWFLILPLFVGSGLVFAGMTNTCGLAKALQLLPYNRSQCGSGTCSL